MDDEIDVDREFDDMARSSIYTLLGFTGSIARSSARVRQLRPSK
jgi:hypothetical protein